MQKIDEDILFIDKPSGITSAGVVRQIKKKLGRRVKVGHAGTLDPSATGLLVIGVGKGTKKLATFLKQDKTYKAEITLGVATDTGDGEGNIIAEESAAHIKEVKIKEVVRSLIGVHKIPVPLFSAIKKDGKPLYKYARSGNKSHVVPPLRDMHVVNTVLLDVRFNGEKVHICTIFDVKSGVYIRSLAEEMGRRLGVPSTLSTLRRIKIGVTDVGSASILSSFLEEKT